MADDYGTCLCGHNESCGVCDGTAKAAFESGRVKALQEVLKILNLHTNCSATHEEIKQLYAGAVHG